MRINVNELYDFCLDILKTVGMPAEEAEILSGALLHADRRGVKSHGVMALGRYVGLLEKGLMSRKLDYTVVTDNPVVAVWNANGGCGHVVGHYAMQAAIEKARAFGIGFVGVKDSNHFGAGAYYSKMAADADMIGIAISTAGPTMAPWGGKDLLLGNNPISLSAPAVTSPQVTLDMALSVVAFGRINNLKKQGHKTIPDGWALDRDGNPTVIADEVYSGMPMSGYKGFGLAIFVDILGGILFGGATGDRAKDEVEGPAHTFLVFDPKAFGASAESFKALLQERIDELTTSPKRDGVDAIYMPGQLEEICFAESETTVEVIDEIVDDLNAMAERFGRPARLLEVK